MTLLWQLMPYCDCVFIYLQSWSFTDGSRSSRWTLLDYSSNCFTRWVVILSRISLEESSWSTVAGRQHSRSILTQSYLLNEIWERKGSALSPNSQSPCCPHRWVPLETLLFCSCHMQICAKTLRQSTADQKTSTKISLPIGPERSEERQLTSHCIRPHTWLPC